MAGRLRLRSLSAIWVGLAFIVGLLSSALWFSSSAGWQDHLDRAYAAGIETYFAVENGEEIAGVTITRLGDEDAAHAQAGRFERVSSTPRPAYVTILSLNDQTSAPTGGTGLKIAVVSDRLQYKVAEITTGTYAAPALKFGELTRLLATYCSGPIIFAEPENSDWLRIDGTAIWGCDAAPRDLRLGAVASAILTIAILATQIGNTTEAFERFSGALRKRTLMGGPESYETSGPRELFEIVQSVNSYLEAERSQLSKRAIILSGVSHDLGTPATRLRLRAALIQDPEIRQKLEADIDQMTNIIESVLTFTRSELNSEQPRQLSLSSLVEAVVADYQDIGEPVQLIQNAPMEAKAGRSVFASRSGKVALGEASKILLHARPVALRRAISNLIDNALKYGRRASVSVSADADWAVITIEDEGTRRSADEMEQLIEPFERGENAQNISGFGLGLTIVATVARQHGGHIAFEDGRSGVRAKLWIRRELG